MSTSRPNAAALETGMTVVVEQNETGDELVGEVRAVLDDDSDHPNGVLVELESGVVGRVQRIGAPD